MDPGMIAGSDRRVLLVATLHGEPIGYEELELHGAGPADLKRMWVAESARGLGVGRRLLTQLEACAADNGAGAVRLDTNHTLVEATSLYRSGQSR